MIQVVVAYDIADNKRRNKIAKCLEGYGIRVNYSVFECVLKPGSLKKMKASLNKLLDNDEDTIRIYHLCKDCIKKVDVFGDGINGFDFQACVFV
ncbi:CRISPR-associated protein Cas2 [Candidatus Magnetomorum sp. HK-1]|nr:CRISPR-associated protein Cas2 [Candidatus Magnetomorum sp. HK-1]